jgi:uncharacterized protein YdhG (YjbR/CyaY superfamily)
MATTSAQTVNEYLASLPPERREVISAVRDAVRAHLPEGMSERFSSGMISWEIPLERYPTTYNKQPLAYAALAAQKNHYALYLMCAYVDPAQDRALRDGFAAAGLKLDMGKSCLRFKRLADIPLDVIGNVIGSTSVEGYIARYEEAREKRS